MTEKIWDFIERKKFIIFFMIITLISIYARIVVIDFVSGDYYSCLEPWFYELKENGGLMALKLDIGNYNLPYLTILALLTYLPVEPIISIKMVSIICDYICALAAMKIVYIVLKENKSKDFFALLVYGIILFLPTVLLNSACWGQADSIYVAFMLLSIVALLEEKYLKSFIYLGISFAFKLQFIFILPLFVLIYISKRKFPLYYFLIIPAVNILMCLPAIAFGKPIASCIDVYINQTSQYSSYLSMNFPGVYNLIFPTDIHNYVIAPNKYISKMGVMCTIFVFAIMAFMVLYKKIKFDKQKIIEFGLWSVMIATFLLPHMHDRYLFAGDILSVLYCIYNKDKLYVPIGISLISMYGYTGFLFGKNPVPIQYLSFMYLVLIVIVTKDIYNKYFNVGVGLDKPEEIDIIK